MVKKYDYLLISIATVLVIISGGGLRWIEFIAPLILLLVYDIINIKKICTKNIGLRKEYNKNSSVRKIVCFGYGSKRQRFEPYFFGQIFPLKHNR